MGRLKPHSGMATMAKLIWRVKLIAELDVSRREFNRPHVHLASFS